MSIRVSQLINLIAVSLLFLVGCSEAPIDPSRSDSLSGSDTSSIESSISGCWQSNYGSDKASITDTYNLEQGGIYSGSRKIMGVETGDTITDYSGKWAVNDGYVLIQDDTRDATITLKVISEYELRSDTDTVYSRC
jgi:hypothetical protein